MLILVNQNRFFRFFQVLEVHSANMVAPIMLSKCKQCNFPIKLWYTQVSEKKWTIFFFSPQRTLACTHNANQLKYAARHFCKRRTLSGYVFVRHIKPRSGALGTTVVADTCKPGLRNENRWCIWFWKIFVLIHLLYNISHIEVSRRNFHQTRKITLYLVAVLQLSLCRTEYSRHSRTQACGEGDARRLLLVMPRVPCFRGIFSVHIIRARNNLAAIRTVVKC